MVTNSRTRQLRVGVIGGGIGGAAAAVALARDGAEVQILEQAPALREIGAGIQLGPNAMKVLRHLDLEEAVRSCSVTAKTIDYRDLQSGERLFETPLGDHASERYGAGMHQIHRADLLSLLADALPSGALTLNAPVTDILDPDGGQATVVLADGQQLEFDCIIGADGIKSTVRERLFGATEPRFTGILGWRLMLTRQEAEPLGFDHACYCWLGAGRSVVIYWLRSGELLNIIGFVPATEVHRESWTESGDIDDLRASFANVTPDVEQLLALPRSAFITGVYDRDPIEQWTRGRIGLLGDAAHPLAPYLAQGACQAIEDAAVLARQLRGRPVDEIPAALAEYEQIRRPRATKVQMAARSAERFWHEADPVQRQARNGRFRGMSRLDPLGETTWAWLYDYDPVTQRYGVGDRSLGVATVRDTHQMRRPQAQQALEAWRSAITPADISRGWQGLRDGYSRFLATTCPPAEGVQVKEVSADGVRCLLVTPPGGSAGGPTVLHLHGGGYMLGSADVSVDLGARLAAAAGGDALVVDYPLAPEHPYPAALDHAVIAYRWLLAQDELSRDVVITGDSAGGALAVAVALKAIATGLAAPAAVYAMSPLADLALRSESIDRFEGTDAAVSRDLLTDMSGSYLQGQDPEDPFASPVYADFTGCPPLLVHAGAEEVLVDDSRRLIEKALAGGAHARLRIFDDEVHAFPLFSFAPDTHAALEDFGQFVQEVAAARA